MHFLQILFKEFNESGIKYAVLRDYEELPYNVGHDLDIGVKSDDLNKAIQLLEIILLENNYRKVYEKIRKDFHQLYFFNNQNCLKVDLWSGFSYKGIRYLDIDKVLDESKIHNNIKVLSESAEVSVTLLKELLHNGSIVKEKIVKLKKKTLLNNNYYNIDGLGNADIMFLNNCIKEQRTSLKSERIFFIKKIFSLSLRRIGYIKTAIDLYKYAVMYIKDYLKIKGAFIVLIGPDGSGKTTLSNKIISEIKDRKSCFNSYYYIHGRFGVMPNLSRIIGKKEDNKTPVFHLVSEKKNTKYLSKIRISLYMLYYLIDYMIGWLILYKQKLSNKIIIADRYYYDYFYQSEYKNYPKFFRFLYSIMAPTPDLLVYLKADSTVIYSRKPELSKNIIKYQQKQIENIVLDTTMHNSCIVVRSDTDLDQSYCDILSKVVLK